MAKKKQAGKIYYVCDRKACAPPARELLPDVSVLRTNQTPPRPVCKSRRGKRGSDP